MSTIDLINAIQAGDAVGIETSFNSVMANKVSDKLDTMRTDMAQTMFAAQAEEQAEEPAEEITTEEETTTEE